MTRGIRIRTRYSRNGAFRRRQLLQLGFEVFVDHFECRDALLPCLGEIKKSQPEEGHSLSDPDLSFQLLIRALWSFVYATVDDFVDGEVTKDSPDCLLCLDK